ncbi:MULTISPECIES: dTDP-4-dehydrorhamnose 3,5-epimerase family protein [Streptomyces]|uniref:dTDP-4-keto-6-deoxy-D-glucose epimerase n=1 Tax=Streptomyces tsukubensis (strain DSM 42081 / NBRC 108919 / NRRL 18488 / 9993) TaxID=1114943 RepID=I2N5C5_STRT9|nr:MULTISPECIES: dTDP-4-dehydrorhamnose 3,5-epimerase [Streptomyces]AZK96264.1 dTDP-4-dehydrorhamnose 3,5-epimerase [Streptomyces tsukubensis]EIF92222.1 dTDP-4-dehydrorhamnose 3,5-epimerase [Streptomyces tsukubensis NRRL18488]QKM67727.1 dTDP-4-keto-6-deoxy-D-glucose epimerase [Streptomyces tsukubensis NRRL18488]
MASTMQSRELSVEGAIEFTPQVFDDERGIFLSPYQESAFSGATGNTLFRVAQTNHSRSQRGVVRGLHYTLTPPGCGKYVYCARGKTLDIAVDIRVGSPTFGRSDAVLLDTETFRAVYFPVGVAHGFVALEDDTVVSYLLSGEYVPEHELALSILDPELALPIPGDIEPILSERDLAAPTLEKAASDGLLPDYAECLAIDRALRSA